MKRSLASALVLLMMSAGTALASGQTITVTTLHDVTDFGGSRRLADLPGPDGKISFREAVTAANNEPGPQTIEFAIPRSEYWLDQYDAWLELIDGAFQLTDDGTTIDFRTQTAFAGDTNPIGWEVGIFGLEPNGWGAAAIYVLGNGCTLIGLDDVQLRGAAVQVVGSGNRILSFTTNGPLGSAINVQGLFGGPAPSGNVIGGTGPGDGNVVSAGNYGIAITGPADDNVVIGNVCIGSKAGGIAVIGATQYGVFVRRNRIGGPTAAERNWVAANGGYGEEGLPGGVQISLVDADDTVVEGNYVGTTQDGMADYPVQIGPAGIGVRDSRGTVVRNNLVSGMLQIGINHYQGQRFGIGISVRGGVDTRVTGNLVGTDALGIGPIPNVAGIGVADVPQNVMIGTTAPGEGNTIAFSEREGVTVDSIAGSVTIRGNQIFANGALGIDLFDARGAGVTPNDQDDVDSQGGNHLQNFPVIEHAVTVGPAVILVGSLNSTPSRRFALDFFASPTSDPSGHGEGAFYLGSTIINTDAGGDAFFNKMIALPVPNGWVVTATATDARLGETSEFSAAALVTNRLPELPLQHPTRP
jgi:hypothetical protein